MEQLIITLEGKANADLLMRLLGKFNFVKSISREKTPSTKATNVVNEEATEYNWTNPARPATDEEFELMIAEAEKEIELGLGIPAEIARKQTMQEIKKWRQKR